MRLSASVSFASTSTGTSTLSSARVAESPWATGASFTGVTVSDTVAVEVSNPSLTVYVKLSGP